MYRYPFDITDLNMSIHDYFEQAIEQLSEAAKKIYKTIFDNPHVTYNREDLALFSRVRRGELNTACLYLEALGLITSMSVGKSKPFKITPLGKTVYETFQDKLQVD